MLKSSAEMNILGLGMDEKFVFFVDCWCVALKKKNRGFE